MGWSQNQMDVFRLSNDMPIPSARAQGMGGAFGAIGADPSSIFLNPAGLGLYKTGVMDLGLNVILKNNVASFDNGSQVQKKYDADVLMPIDHFTWVRSYPSKNPDWKMFNVALSHGKMAHYRRSFEILADTKNTSMLDAFAVEAQGTSFDAVTGSMPFSAGLAWQTYGIDTVPGTVNTYYANFLGGNVQQSHQVQQDGKKTDFGGALSANYRDQLFLGISLSLQSYTFSENIIHKEVFPDAGEILQIMEYASDLTVQGSAAQWRLGAIWIPERYPWVRVGMAYHSGVNFYCSDNFSADMTTQFTTTQFQFSSPVNQINYYIKTPPKFQFNSAFNVGDRWLLGADVERVNFSNGQISNAGNNTYDYLIENQAVAQQGHSATRIRLGAECRLDGPLRLRVGWDYQSSPYAQASQSQNFHGGLGFRFEKFFIDASLSMGSQNQSWYMYDSRLIASAQVNTWQTSARFSFGWRLSDFHQEEDRPDQKPLDSGTGDF